MNRITETIILNLDHLQKRYQKTVQEITGTYLDFNTTRCSAVNGFDLEHANQLEKFVNKHGYDDVTKRHDLYHKIMVPLQETGIIDTNYIGIVKPGAIGNYMSWANILKRITENNNDYTIVLEDDILISDKKQFNMQYDKLFSELPPDFDVIYMGTSVFSKIHCTRYNGSLNKITSDTTQISGLYGIIISRKAAIKLIKNWLPMKSESDIEFTNRIIKRELDAYHTVSDIVQVDYDRSYTASAVKKGINVSYVRNSIKREMIVEDVKY